MKGAIVTYDAATRAEPEWLIEAIYDEDADIVVVPCEDVGVDRWILRRYRPAIATVATKHFKENPRLGVWSVTYDDNLRAFIAVKPRCRKEGTIMFWPRNRDRNASRPSRRSTCNH